MNQHHYCYLHVSLCILYINGESDGNTLKYQALQQTTTPWQEVVILNKLSICIYVLSMIKLLSQTYLKPIKYGSHICIYFIVCEFCVKCISYILNKFFMVITLYFTCLFRYSIHIWSQNIHVLDIFLQYQAIFVTSSLSAPNLINGNGML